MRDQNLRFEEPETDFDKPGKSNWVKSEIKNQVESSGNRDQNPELG